MPIHILMGAVTALASIGAGQAAFTQAVPTEITVSYFLE